jgi:uncharacterized OsmC-like protein
MNVVVTGKFVGGKSIELTHEPSGSKIVTDAPKDNGGEGQLFSPTDLVVAGLGSCVLTTIALVAHRSVLVVDGMHMRAEKIMADAPRRIGEILLNVHLPKSLDVFDRQKLERAGLGCPVHKSLRSDIPVRVQFLYDVE